MLIEISCAQMARNYCQAPSLLILYYNLKLLILFLKKLIKVWKLAAWWGSALLSKNNVMTANLSTMLLHREKHKKAQQEECGGTQHRSKDGCDVVCGDVRMYRNV